MRLAALGVSGERGEAVPGGASPLLDAAERCLQVAESSADQVGGLVLVNRQGASTAFEAALDLGFGGQALTLTLHAGAEGLAQSLILGNSLLESASLERVLILLDEMDGTASALLLESDGPSLAAQSFGHPGESGVGEDDPTRRLLPLSRQLLAAAGWAASDVDLLLTDPPSTGCKKLLGLTRSVEAEGAGSLLRRIAAGPLADRLALPARVLLMGWSSGRAFAGVAMALTGVRIAPVERWMLETAR